MKRNELRLNELKELKVQSFTTSIEEDQTNVLRGGTTPGCGVPISAGIYNCYPSNSFNIECERLSIGYCDPFNDPK